MFVGLASIKISDYCESCFVTQKHKIQKWQLQHHKITNLSILEKTLLALIVLW